MPEFSKSQLEARAISTLLHILGPGIFSLPSTSFHSLPCVGGEASRVVHFPSRQAFPHPKNRRSSAGKLWCCTGVRIGSQVTRVPSFYVAVMSLVPLSDLSKASSEVYWKESNETVLDI